MSNETPTWMAVLEAVKAEDVAHRGQQEDQSSADEALWLAMTAWRDDTSQGPEGYPMPPTEGYTRAVIRAEGPVAIAESIRERHNLPKSWGPLQDAQQRLSNLQAEQHRDQQQSPNPPAKR